MKNVLRGAFCVVRPISRRDVILRVSTHHAPRTTQDFYFVINSARAIRVLVPKPVPPLGNQA